MAPTLVDPEDVLSSALGVSDALPFSLCPGVVDVELSWDVDDLGSEVVEDDVLEVVDDDSGMLEVDEDFVEVGATPMVVMADGVPGKNSSFLFSSQLASSAERELMQKYRS